MSRNRRFAWNPLIPEQPLPPRLWAGLLFAALLACALSVGLIAGVHALGGGGFLLVVDDVWARFLGALTAVVPVALAFILPSRPTEPGPQDEKHRVSSIAIRMVTFLFWNVAVFAATVFSLRRFSEPLGLDTLALPQDGVYLAQAMSLFWTVAFFTTVFVLDARHHKVPPA